MASGRGSIFRDQEEAAGAAKGTDLDRWARALGVTNDADAVAAVRELYRLVLNASACASPVVRLVRALPDTELNRDTANIVWNLRASADMLLRVQRGFEDHMRGGD